MPILRSLEPGSRAALLAALLLAAAVPACGGGADAEQARRVSPPPSRTAATRRHASTSSRARCSRTRRSRSSSTSPSRRRNGPRWTSREFDLATTEPDLGVTRRCEYRFESREAVGGGPVWHSDFDIMVFPVNAIALAEDKRKPIAGAGPEMFKERGTRGAFYVVKGGLAVTLTGFPGRDENEEGGPDAGRLVLLRRHRRAAPLMSHEGGCALRDAAGRMRPAPRPRAAERSRRRPARGGSATPDASSSPRDPRPARRRRASGPTRIPRRRTGWRRGSGRTEPGGRYPGHADGRDPRSRARTPTRSVTRPTRRRCTWSSSPPSPGPPPSTRSVRCVLLASYEPCGSRPATATDPLPPAGRGGPRGHRRPAPARGPAMRTPLRFALALGFALGSRHRCSRPLPRRKAGAPRTPGSSTATGSRCPCSGRCCRRSTRRARRPARATGTAIPTP